jgi:hypothetical protein
VATASGAVRLEHGKPVASVSVAGRRIFVRRLLRATASGRGVFIVSATAAASGRAAAAAVGRVTGARVACASRAGGCDAAVREIGGNGVFELVIDRGSVGTGTSGEATADQAHAHRAKPAHCLRDDFVVHHFLTVASHLVRSITQRWDTQRPRRRGYLSQSVDLVNVVHSSAEVAPRR